MTSLLFYNDYMKYVIFDFNGTVVDDVDVSIECLNLCIEKYLDRPPIDKEEYLKILLFLLRNIMKMQDLILIF